MKRIEKRMHVRGLVLPLEWDDDDNVSAVTVFNDTNEYLIADSGIGKELLELVSHQVEVHGIVNTNTDGNPVLTVEKYVIRAYPDEEYTELEFDDLEEVKGDHVLHPR